MEMYNTKDIEFSDLFAREKSTLIIAFGLFGFRQKQNKQKNEKNKRTKSKKISKKTF